jgi:hypothetical protein
MRTRLATTATTISDRTGSTGTSALPPSGEMRTSHLVGALARRRR